MIVVICILQNVLIFRDQEEMKCHVIRTEVVFWKGEEERT